ncbi:MAG TPA: DNA-directed RNA polymerase subunit omega [Bacillota bacterium]|nr:DNA-directed RNA polymerase subunit omega [Bacillota bacterium]
MIFPPLDELLKHADNRFMLVTVAAKRARQIIGNEVTGEGYSDKAVTIALEEIVSEKTKYDRTKTKSGIK